MHPLHTKLGTSPLLGLLGLDQVAFIARSDTDEMLIKRFLRLDQADWVEDEVVAKGYVRGVEGEATNTAKLLFNYDFGIEVEILRYLDGPNYPEIGAVPAGNVAHLGFHVEKGKHVPPAMKDFVFSCPIIQQVVTQSHTNQFLIDSGRRYRYTIYDTKPLFGIYLKVIERLEADHG